MLQPLLLLLPVPFLPQDAQPIPARIVEVTVYGDSALVRRRAELPPGGGRFVIEDLPRTIDPENVRVTCTGGDVAGVEVRERIEREVPDARVQELRDQLRDISRERLQRQRDEYTILERIGAHLEGLLSSEQKAQATDVANGRANPDVWAKNLNYVQEELTANRTASRELGWAIEDTTLSYAAVEAELGKLQSGGEVRLFDAHVDVVANGGATLDLETFVAGTGWTPVYDLRTSKDARSVELVYRARVTQETGEDWADVELFLSTARPKLGAQGPEPQPQWVDSSYPNAGRHGVTSFGLTEDSLDLAAEMEPAAESAAAVRAPAPRPFAAVLDEGLSVRFALAQRETVESRSQYTTVLIGKATLEAEPEHYCVPSLDPTVWLRGIATNTSDWTLLPGSAAIFFGNDYLGRATLESVQPDEEFTLHLGSVAGLTVTRDQVQDKTKKPGFLSSKRSLIEGWRIHLENHGSPAANDDGSVDVVIQEVLPRSKDSRIEVELHKVSPALSVDSRWALDRKEKGFLTWDVRVPRAGERDVVLESKISYPKSIELARY